MATANVVIDKAWRQLYSGNRPEFTTLDGAIDTDDTTLTFERMPSGIVEGATLAVDLEHIPVYDTDAGARTATVQRGMDGSTAASHTSGTVVWVNPRFSRFQIFEAMNEELDDLSTPDNGLFRTRTVTLTYNASRMGYDLTSLAASFIDVLDVFYQPTGNAHHWPRTTAYELRRDMETSDFASGSAIVLYEPGYPGRDIRIRYKAPFTNLAAASDDVQTVSFLPATCNDILAMGAALRLAAPREIKRNFSETQGDTRRAEEVPPGAELQSMRALAALRLQRIKAEADRLAEQNPIYKELIA